MANENLKPMTRELRDAILADIIDWELDTHHSLRTDRNRMRSSRAIAEARGVTPLQVGGIRSNFRAGRYGTVKHLRAKRRAARQAAQSA